MHNLSNGNEREVDLQNNERASKTQIRFETEVTAIRK